MVTYTYYVVRFFKNDDPCPKFLGSDTQVGLFQLCSDFGIALKDGLIVTMAEEIKNTYLCIVDTCTFCRDCCGKLCFCGKPVIHSSSLFE